MGSREEKKAEEALKALLKLPANKRCINCDSQGPQYVVSAFNVFVCTSCSGVHRQFGHRVKGVSMSTFKPDEVAALKEAGNEKFAAFFLNKWTAAALPKPVEREGPRVHAWITAVYQDRRFYGEPADGWTAGASGARSVASSTTASEVGEPAVRPLHEVLGAGTPKLQVQHSGTSRHLERSVSAASSSAAGGATPTRAATVPAPSSSSTGPQRQASLLDVPSPKSARSAPPGAVPAAGGAWDPFGAASPKAAAPAAATPAAEAGWASFGDVAPETAPQPQPPQQEQQQQQQQPAAVPPAAPAAEGSLPSSSPWEAFGDAPAAAAEPAAPAAAVAAAASASSSPAGKQLPPTARQPVASNSRAEVSMDIFFPEFEQIRATGMLPNGQPVPLPAFSHSYSSAGARGGAPPPPPQHGANPYAAYSGPGAAQQHPAYAGGYGAAPPPRPTIAIPPAPQQPGGYHGGVSPAGFYPGMPSPGVGPYSSPSGYSTAGSVPSPAGSIFSASSQQGYAPANGGFDPRGSTGSLGELMFAGSAAPTPGVAAPHDPFAGLAPGLRAALPAVPANGNKAGVPPPPTPAGGPPFAANGGGFPGGGYPGGPFAAPSLSPAGLPPASAAASATLFGHTPSFTAYDMSAPAAPKPQASGNPFA